LEDVKSAERFVQWSGRDSHQPGSVLPMTVERYAFNDGEAITAAGVSMRIPGGAHEVERRVLVFRARLHGGEVDVTRAEWERLRRGGCVGPLPVVVDSSQGTGATHPG
jgi:hypothetical protein